MRRLEMGHEVDRGREVGPVADLGGGDPEGDRQVRFPDPGGPRNRALRRSSTKRRVESSAMTARSIEGWKSNSNWERRLSSG